MKNKEQMVEVYRASGDMQAQVIKGLLESYGIPCLLSSNAAASVHVLTVDGMGEVKVLVWASMSEKANRLIVGEGHA